MTEGDGSAGFVVVCAANKPAWIGERVDAIALERRETAPTPLPIAEAAARLLGDTGFDLGFESGDLPFDR